MYEHTFGAKLCGNSWQRYRVPGAYEYIKCSLRFSLGASAPKRGQFFSVAFITQEAAKEGSEGVD